MQLSLEARAVLQSDSVRIAVALTNGGAQPVFARNAYSPGAVPPHLQGRVPAGQLTTPAAAAIWGQGEGTVAVFQGYTNHWMTGPSPYHWRGPSFSRLRPGEQSRYEIVLSNPLEEWENNWVPERLLAAVPVHTLWFRIETSPGLKARELDGMPGVWEAERSAEFVEAKIRLEAPVGFRAFDTSLASNQPAGMGPPKRRAGKPMHHYDAAAFYASQGPGPGAPPPIM